MTKLSFVEQVADVDDLLEKAANGGQCAAWIRNTVDDAIGAYRRLAVRLGRERVHLFHARFAMGHRLAIERHVLARFGADSGPHERRGHVLVATQVIEQSLDLDFDVMVTDLAPMDLLLQRAGRLRRHARQQDGTRVSGTDQRGDAVLHVLAPHWDADPGKGWLAASDTQRTRFVYEDLGQLWRTMQVALELGELAVPRDARLLIARVFDPGARCPEGLRAAVQRASTAERIAGSVADLNALELDRGYMRAEDSWLDDRRTPTRLGAEATTVRLGVVDGRALHPLAATGRSDSLAWELSSLRVRATRVCERVVGDHDELVRRAVASMSDAAQWALVLPMVPVGSTRFRGRARGARGRDTALLYDNVEGLTFEEDEV